ncbi:uncharacterized protein LOC121749810 [Salvia splendens]|uniref:uncharacterized protein LOC121749810 n=1 Tax=Salvia splendens TaxID=180675 RepID=UPI001C2658CD|nr:uncharacterized protein LOC121749810 [Salvia splendens]
MNRRRFISRLPLLLIYASTILIIYSPALISAAVVTLDNIEIFKTHEWIPTKPKVYFHCKGESEIILPDVTDKHVLYSFRGEESWQPLTELSDTKCKRCGLYEKDAVRPNYVFDEWELCPSDFTRSDGKYIHVREKEFNATFLCKECVAQEKASSSSSSSLSDKDKTNSTNAKQEDSSKMLPWPLIVVISCASLILFTGGLVAGCKWWQRRKRMQQQAQFLKLFEDADDIEDELGIGPLSHTV